MGFTKFFFHPEISGVKKTLQQMERAAMSTPDIVSSMASLPTPRTYPK